MDINLKYKDWVGENHADIASPLTNSDIEVYATEFAEWLVKNFEGFFNQALQRAGLVEAQDDHHYKQPDLYSRLHAVDFHSGNGLTHRVCIIQEVQGVAGEVKHDKGEQGQEGHSQPEL